MKTLIHRTDLAFCLKQTKANSPLKSSSKTDWVEVDLTRDAYLLGAELTFSEPIFQNGLWCTISDFDTKSNTFSGDRISFLNLHMTVSAFEGAIASLNAQENIKKVEDDVQKHYINKQFIDLTKAVCTWGGSTGNRVWGNLEKRCATRQADGEITINYEPLVNELKEWLDFAHAAKLPEQSSQILAKGEAIKGLGVSYASKHLRLLFPNYFPVLDSLISIRFGFATNIRGFELFLDHLHQFQASNPALGKYSIGDIEAGIFKLIRNGQPPN